MSGHGSGGAHPQASASGEGGAQMATHSNIASIILAQVCGAYAHFSKQHGGREGQVPELLFFMRYVSDICLDVGIFVCFTITSCSVFISRCRICLVFFCVLIV